jgi:hypothetical protein
MVWAHWRNFGFLLASSYSQKQTPQVTKSSNSLVTPMVNIQLCVRRVTTYFQLTFLSVSCRRIDNKGANFQILSALHLSF